MQLRQLLNKSGDSVIVKQICVMDYECPGLAGHLGE